MARPHRAPPSTPRPTTPRCGPRSTATSTWPPKPCGTGSTLASLWTMARVRSASTAQPESTELDVAAAYRLAQRAQLLGLVGDPQLPSTPAAVARFGKDLAAKLAEVGVGRGDVADLEQLLGAARRQPAARAGVGAAPRPARRRAARPAARDLAEQPRPLRRRGHRPTPDVVAARLHVLAMVCADLRAGYNDYGIRRWFVRPRPSLEGGVRGRSPRPDLGPRRSGRRPRPGAGRVGPVDRGHVMATLWRNTPPGAALPLGGRQRPPGPLARHRRRARPSTSPTRPPGRGPSCCVTRRSWIRPTSPAWPATCGPSRCPTATWPRRPPIDRAARRPARWAADLRRLPAARRRGPGEGSRRRGGAVGRARRPAPPPGGGSTVGSSGPTTPTARSWCCTAAGLAWSASGRWPRASRRPTWSATSARSTGGPSEPASERPDVGPGGRVREPAEPEQRAGGGQAQQGDGGAGEPVADLLLDRRGRGDRLAELLVDLLQLLGAGGGEVAAAGLAGELLQRLAVDRHVHRLAVGRADRAAVGAEGDGVHGHALRLGGLGGLVVRAPDRGLTVGEQHDRGRRLGRLRRAGAVRAGDGRRGTGLACPPWPPAGRASVSIAESDV